MGCLREIARKEKVTIRLKVKNRHLNWFSRIMRMNRYIYKKNGRARNSKRGWKLRGERPPKNMKWPAQH